MISLDCIETIVSFPAILILKSVRKVLSYRLWFKVSVESGDRLWRRQCLKRLRIFSVP